MTPEELEHLFLREWAGTNKCHFEPEGEVGILRECVGIAHGGQFVDLGPPTEEVIGGHTYYFPKVHPLAYSPEGVTNAYHKHDCLAVLGRGPEAVHQLYLWVKHLAEHDFHVEVVPRPAQNVLEVAFHGLTVACLVKGDA